MVVTLSETEANEFSCTVGNISPTDVLPLETLRQGLRGDTFFNFLPQNIADSRKLI